MPYTVPHHDDVFELASLACNSKDPEQLDRMSYLVDVDIADSVARNPHTPKSTLRRVCLDYIARFQNGGDPAGGEPLPFLSGSLMRTAPFSAVMALCHAFPTYRLYLETRLNMDPELCAYYEFYRAATVIGE